ncbi:MAG: hypothetical protein JJU29_09200 [Verrucomicrobia bacterium]|nr:hypothetical protein [Verrucomicrobiota bacterium]
MPGSISDVQGVDPPQREGVVKLITDGKEALALMEARAEDEAFWESLARRSQPPGDAETTELMFSRDAFGDERVQRVTVQGPMRDVLAYQEEVEAARQDFH